MIDGGIELFLWDQIISVFLLQSDYIAGEGTTSQFDGWKQRSTWSNNKIQWLKSEVKQVVYQMSLLEIEDKKKETRVQSMSAVKSQISVGILSFQI